MIFCGTWTLHEIQIPESTSKFSWNAIILISVFLYAMSVTAFKLQQGSLVSRSNFSRAHLAGTPYTRFSLDLYKRSVLTSAPGLKARITTPPGVTLPNCRWNLLFGIGWFFAFTSGTFLNCVCQECVEFCSDWPCMWRRWVFCASFKPQFWVCMSPGTFLQSVREQIHRLAVFSSLQPSRRWTWKVPARSTPR